MKTIKPINWRRPPPEKFLCMICKQARAMYHVKIDELYNLTLCAGCANLSEPELRKRFNIVKWEG